MKRACDVDVINYDLPMDEEKRTGKKIGYVRVSDKDQSEALQVDALKAAGCDLIYGDHGVSGAIKQRRGLDDMLVELQSGDTLVVWKLDRLGRSTIHLLQLLSVVVIELEEPAPPLPELVPKAFDMAELKFQTVVSPQRAEKYSAVIRSVEPK